MQINNLPNAFSSIAEAAQSIRKAERPDAGAAESKPAESFEQVFQNVLTKSSEPTFSKHAGTRMVQRDISLSPEELAKLTDAIGMAKDKGVRNTLVLMERMAFIVNVPDNVVITAMNGHDLKENVFTQIDGAVIV